MRIRRTGLWVLAAASFALAAWLLLPFPERAHPEQSAPTHSSVEDSPEPGPSAG